MAMCEDYPCCGHTPNDPCGSEGPSAEEYLLAWSRRGNPEYWDTYE